jgi:uncharacterized protein
MRHGRRSFLRGIGAAGFAVGAAGALGPRAFGESKTLLLFTKSSGFEHQVVKQVNGEPSTVETVVTAICKKHGYVVQSTKDGRIFDSPEFAKFQAAFFFTTGVLTEEGTDKNPAMTVAGKARLLDAIHNGMGFVGSHAAADTYHTPPDPTDLSNRYIAHGESSDPYLRMLGGEFIIHGSTPRLQTAKVVINDPNFPGLEGVQSPVEFTEEWYSLKDFMPDLHVIATVDTEGMLGEPYQRPPYPMTWARMHGKGRVFYTAIGDRTENWQEPFFVNLLDGGIRFAMGDAKAKLTKNLKEVDPGYAVIPPKNAKKA